MRLHRLGGRLAGRQLPVQARSGARHVLLQCWVLHGARVLHLSAGPTHEVGSLVGAARVVHVVRRVQRRVVGVVVVPGGDNHRLK